MPFDIFCEGKFSNNEILFKENLLNLKFPSEQKDQTGYQNWVEKNSDISLQTYFSFVQIWQLENEIQKYYRITNLIESHILKRPSHPLYQIRQIFITSFKEEYSNYITSFDNINLNCVLKQMIDEIIEFIFLFIQVIAKFYRIRLFTEPYEELMKNQKASQARYLRIISEIYNLNNCYNFVLSLMFASEELYSICFGVQKLLDRQITQKFKLNLQKYQIVANQSPTELGISPQFCLDQETIEFIINTFFDFNIEIPSQLQQPQQQSTVKDKRLSFQDGQEVFPQEKITMDTYNLQSQRSNSEIYQKESVLIAANLNQESILSQHMQGHFNQARQKLLKKLSKMPAPYQQAIEVLKKIEGAQSPLHKLLILTTMAKAALSSILNFYFEMDVSESFELSSSDLIFIYIYIFVKADVDSLLSHFNFIENFIDQEDLQPKHSEFFSYFSIRASIDYIEGIKENSDHKARFTHLLCI